METKSRPSLQQLNPEDVSIDHSVVLGSGTFSDVHPGTMGKRVRVAVKVFKGTEDAEKVSLRFMLRFQPMSRF